MGFLEKLLSLGDEVKNTASLLDRVMMGLQTALIGMSVIFTVLVILWAVLALFKVVLYKDPNKSKKGEPKTEEVSEELDAATLESNESKPNEEEIVAAITAAVAIMLDKPETSFRVVSFRRTASK